MSASISKHDLRLQQSKHLYAEIVCQTVGESFSQTERESSGRFAPTGFAETIQWLFVIYSAELQALWGQDESKDDDGVQICNVVCPPLAPLRCVLAVKKNCSVRIGVGVIRYGLLQLVCTEIASPLWKPSGPFNSKSKRLSMLVLRCMKIILQAGANYLYAVEQYPFPQGGQFDHGGATGALSSHHSNSSPQIVQQGASSRSVIGQGPKLRLT